VNALLGSGLYFVLHFVKDITAMSKITTWFAIALSLFNLTLMLPAQAAGGATAGPDLGRSYPEATGLGSTDIRITVAKIIRVAMSLLGIIALVVILIGGFTWMTAGGNDEKVGEAKKWIFSGIIGMVIILSAFAISTFVINSLIAATVSGDANIPLETGPNQ
jgi:hypothetical protein